MKPFLFLLLSSVASHSQVTSSWQTRMIQSQIQGAVGIPELVADQGERPSLPIGAKGSRFELWGIQIVDGSIARQELIDTTEVGLYLPATEISITTQDPHTGFHRSRVDQPFTVSFKVSNLLPPGPLIPTAATKVLVEHYVDLYELDNFDGTAITSTALLTSFELTTNGVHPRQYDVTNLTAPDLIRRSGRERFIVYALADGPTPRREIAKAEVIMCPVSEGLILGLDLTKTYKSLPDFTADIWRTYPGTLTWVEVYDGEYSAGRRGIELPGQFPAPGYNYPDTFTELKLEDHPSTVQPTASGKKTIVLRASSPFSNESTAQGGRILDYKTISMGNQITVHGLVTTME
ncbi:MAG: hypothetical protein ACRCXD_12260 [Luteolibacter sp.]